MMAGIENIENLRATGNIKAAAVQAAREVGYVFSFHAFDPVVYPPLADSLDGAKTVLKTYQLLNILGDSEKTLANSSILPRHVQSHLLDASVVVNDGISRRSLTQPLLRSENFKEVAQGYRTHSMILRAAMPLYNENQRAVLNRVSHNMLFHARNILTPEDPLYYVVDTELLLERLHKEDLSWRPLADNVEKLAKMEFDTNPQEVATVASWVISAAIRHHHPAVRQRSEKIYNEVTSKYPQYDFMGPKETLKRLAGGLRFSFISGTSTLPGVLSENWKIRIYNNLV
ncbi:MAG TPA: hypothetical protein VF828_03420 [Patescibacteria group bacterium]